MTCLEAEPLIHAYLDGELDLAGSLNVERHLADCAACAAQYAGLERLREEIAAADPGYRPSRDLERKIRAAGRRHSVWRGAPLLAVAAVVLLAVLVPLRTNVSGTGEGREVLDSHLRSLTPNHLVDVPSSDQHTVKPWFQGKTSFSPPVPDLSASGFTLIGGRLEVMRKLPAAAIVYKRREHIVSLYVVQAEGGSARPVALAIDGYHLLRWTENGLSYAAVSDLNAAELSTFAELIRSH